jgi:predicted Zn finger-like uncharacterized protein
MDVKCERCGTEYEFDDNRVTEDGVSVQCSSCGHLFRIHKKSLDPVQPPAQETRFKTDLVGTNRLWMVRKPDGTVLVFKDLTVLQKWISENKVSRDDEISRTGDNWKRLGDIAELASFFRSVDQTNFQPAPYSQPSSPPFVAPQSSPSLPAHPPPGAPSFATSAVSSPALPMGSGSSPSTPPAVPAGPATSYLPAQAALSMSTINTIQDDHGEPDSWGDPEIGNVEEDVVQKWKRRGRRKWFFIGPLALIAIGIGVGYVLAPVEFRKLVGAAIGIETEDTAAVEQPQHPPGVEEKKNDINDDAKPESRVTKESEESVKPTEPIKPDEPVKPIEVVKPVEPAKPLAPAKPTTYDGWMSLADRLQRTKRIREALVAYDAALNLKPEDVEALTGKGQCLMDMGAYPAASALFERALAVHPRFGDALIGLAEAHKFQGNRNEALTYYKKYLDLLPDGPDADLARENINELKQTQ